MPGRTGGDGGSWYEYGHARERSARRARHKRLPEWLARGCSRAVRTATLAPARRCGVGGRRGRTSSEIGRLGDTTSTPLCRCRARVTIASAFAGRRSQRVSRTTFGLPVGFRRWRGGPSAWGARPRYGCRRRRRTSVPSGHVCARSRVGGGAERAVCRAAGRGRSARVEVGHDTDVERRIEQEHCVIGASARAGPGRRHADGRSLPRETQTPRARPRSAGMRGCRPGSRRASRSSSYDRDTPVAASTRATRSPITASGIRKHGVSGGGSSPPSTPMTCPVWSRDASEANHTMTSATSSAVPSREPDRLAPLCHRVRRDVGDHVRLDDARRDRVDPGSHTGRARAANKPRCRRSQPWTRRGRT